MWHESQITGIMTGTVPVRCVSSVKTHKSIDLAPHQIQLTFYRPF